MKDLYNSIIGLLDVKLPGPGKMLLSEYIVHMFFVIVITYVVIFITKNLLHQFFDKTNFIEEKKEQTIESVFSNTSKYLAAFIIMFCAIQPFFDLKQLLVAGGVLGIVIGFGAQSLISDIFTGIFLLFEKQFQKGDFVQINEDLEGGSIEEVGFRVVKIRKLDGKLMIIPNGQIKKVINGNIHRRRIFENIVISFREDPEKIRTILEELCEKLNEVNEQYLSKDENGEYLEKYKFNGLSSLDNNPYGYRYTIVATVLDTDYIDAARETKYLLAKAMYDNKIEMAEQQMYYKTRLKG